MASHPVKYGFMCNNTTGTMKLHNFKMELGKDVWYEICNQPGCGTLLFWNDYDDKIAAFAPASHGKCECEDQHMVCSEHKETFSCTKTYDEEADESESKKIKA